MPPPALPITLQIGDVTADLGHVELPLTSKPAGRDAAGLWQLDISVDHTELRRRVADRLRDVAAQFERGPTNGE